MNSATYGQTRFHFSSGLEGPVIVNVPSTAFHDTYFPDEKTAKPLEIEPGTYQVEIPGEDIVALVLDSFRTELVKGIEDADDETMKELLRSAIQEQRHQVKEDIRWLLGDVVKVLRQVGQLAETLTDQDATKVTIERRTIQVARATNQLARALTLLHNGELDAAKTYAADAERAVEPSVE